MQNFSQSLNKPVKYIPPGYHIAKDNEVQIINDLYIKNINIFSKFYEKNLANKTIDYVFKSKKQLKLLSVNFGKENFAHLLGLRFDRRKPNQVLTDILNDKTPNAILIKNDRTTFLKLQVLSSIKGILHTDGLILSDLSQIEQIHKLNLNKGIRSFDKNLMILLRTSQSDGIVPASLMNLNIRNLSEQLKNVPQNTILGIFQESNNEVAYLSKTNKKRKIILGRSASAIDLNHEYIKTPLDALSLASVLNKSLSTHTKNITMSEKRKNNQLLHTSHHTATTHDFVTNKGEKQTMNIDELKKEVENYPVIVDGYAKNTDTTYLVKLKDRATDLNMTVAKGNELKGNSREDRDSLYLIKPNMAPIKIGNNLQDILDTITVDGILDGNRVTTLPISLSTGGKVPDNGEIKRQFGEYADSVNKIANDELYFGQLSTSSKEYLAGVNGSYAVKNNDNKWEIHPARQALKGQIEGEWGFALKDINSLDKLDSSTPVYATSDKAKDVRTKLDFQKSSQKILEDSNAQKHAHFPIDERSINLMARNELEYAINSGTTLDSIENEITNDISDNFNAYSDITEGRWGLVKRSYVDNLTAQTQMIDFYTYDPNQNKKPKLIANDLQDLKFKLDNDQIKDDISIKENKRVDPQEYEMYLKNRNIYMNPSREDFEIANENAGKDKNSNLKGITNTPQTENELNRIYAKRFLKENGLEYSQKNISSVAKNLAWNREYNQAWNKSNPTKPQKDTSAKAAYLEENTIFKNPEFKSEYISNYGKKTSTTRHQKVSKYFKNMSSDQNLDM